VQIFFLPYLKENYINFWIILTLEGYPAGYPAGQSGIRPDTGYKKISGLSGRISGASLIIINIFNVQVGPNTAMAVAQVVGSPHLLLPAPSAIINHQISVS
jgi:hypothetical protein